MKKDLFRLMWNESMDYENENISELFTYVKNNCVHYTIIQSIE